MEQLVKAKAAERECLARKDAELEEEASKLEMEVALKQQSVEEKRQLYSRLKRNLAEVEESDSFLNLSQYKEAIRIDPRNVGQQVVVIHESRKQLTQHRASRLYSGEEHHMNKHSEKKDDDLSGGCHSGCRLF